MPDDTSRLHTSPWRAHEHYTALLYIDPGFPRNASRAETETHMCNDSFTQPC